MNIIKTLTGGTFDVIHGGHQVLLDKAIELAEIYNGQLIITLVSDKMASAKSHSVNTYTTRRTRLTAYLKAQDFEQEVYFVPLESKVLDEDMIREVFDDDEKVTIIVSEESYPDALEINKLFISIGLEPITVVVVPMLLAEDGKRISSTRVRNEEITLSGNILR